MHTHMSLHLFPCPSCQCSSFILYSFTVFFADSASIISLSCLRSPSFYPPSHYRYCICTQCIFYKYPLDVHSFKWGTVGFSEQCVMHFKSTNICLIFWFRFQHVRKELYSIMEGVVIQIQLIALERWKRVTHPAWGGQRKLDRGGNNIWGGPWREKCGNLRNLWKLRKKR